MAIVLPLSKMSLSEKLQVMEELWDDLSQPTSKYSPPEWHGDILNERERDFNTGKIPSTDWDEAKKAIRDQIR